MVPGLDRTGPSDLEGPVVPLSRDLRSPKVPGLENGKVPGKMPTLIEIHARAFLPLNISAIGTVGGIRNL